MAKYALCHNGKKISRFYSTLLSVLMQATEADVVSISRGKIKLADGYTIKTIEDKAQVLAPEKLEQIPPGVKTDDAKRWLK
jgi:hypothetical protein